MILTESSGSNAKETTMFTALAFGIMLVAITEQAWATGTVFGVLAAILANYEWFKK